MQVIPQGRDRTAHFYGLGSMALALSLGLRCLMQNDETGNEALTKVLAWYRAMGADVALGDAAIDWLERGNDAPGTGFTRPQPASFEPAALPVGISSQPPARPTPSPVKRPVSLAGSGFSAKTAEVTAASLQDLEAKLSAFEGCGLKTTATKLCFYRGAAKADLMVIGEAPGREEDLEGRPFVGRAGQLLDKMLAAIGLTGDDVHLTNIVYWRPPGNRTPTPLEALACRPFLERHIQLVEPKVLLVLGDAAAKHTLDTTDAIMRLRGNWQDRVFGGHACKVMPTLHPEYLFSAPAAKRQAWRDILIVKNALTPRVPATTA